MSETKIITREVKSVHSAQKMILTKLSLVEEEILTKDKEVDHQFICKDVAQDQDQGREIEIFVGL